MRRIRVLVVASSLKPPINLVVAFGPLNTRNNHHALTRYVSSLVTWYYWYVYDMLICRPRYYLSHVYFCGCPGSSLPRTPNQVRHFIHFTICPSGTNSSGTPTQRSIDV
ncbi:hypothetical protein B0J17DRAFT_664455 [Rhizoctonia solani]|nr:hypothetical protein B0J17DRAFT_664455 [Rhizoctonia solani]